MRKMIMAALLLPGTALANNTTINGPAYFNQPNTASASANATGGAGGAGGSASAGASAGSSSASQTSRIVVAPALPGMASGPCTGPGGGVSFGVVGFAGGAGYTSMDKGCDARETARILLQVGLPDHARAVMLREYRRVMEGDGAPRPMPTYNQGSGQ